MSTFRGRDARAHNRWIRDNADYFTVFLYRGRSTTRAENRYECSTADEAIAIAQQVTEGSTPADRPAMIYAVKDIHWTLVATYSPFTGLRVTND
jgi:hypothetical protein